MWVRKVMKLGTVTDVKEIGNVVWKMIETDGQLH